MSPVVESDIPALPGDTCLGSNIPSLISLVDEVPLGPGDTIPVPSLNISSPELMRPFGAPFPAEIAPTSMKDNLSSLLWNAIS